MKCLVVVSEKQQREQERRLIRLADCAGVSARQIHLPECELDTDWLFGVLHPDTGALAISAGTLAGLLTSQATAARLWRFLDHVEAKLLVFDWSESAEKLQALAAFLDEAVAGVSEIATPGVEISFPETAKDCSGPLAGSSYVRRDGAPVMAFEVRGQPPRQVPIVSANGSPMLLRTEKSGTEIFLLGGPPLLDPDVPMSRESELRNHYAGLLPLLIFLRCSFGNLCWRNPAPTARLILDDPLIARRYGFLDFSALLESARHNHYGASIAFIPWNGWRASKRDVERFLDPRSLSLCVHGCDHANREFESQDAGLLAAKAALALRRMRALASRTGAAFEPVMVFPQERYTVDAIAALRGQPYLAAVNTICVPIDSAPNDLAARDFIAPAITRYHGFPIFQRRYPRRFFDFASDLFLGKPALVAEHHDYFERGLAPLEEFAAALRRMEPDLRWPNLDSQLTECNLRRLGANGSTDVRFFTRRFRLMARDGESGRYALSKHEPDARRIKGVHVDGRPVDFEVERGFLRLELTAEPGRAREIVIVDRAGASHASEARIGLRHNARVLVRRALSEFRDNTLSRHPRLHLGAQWLAKKLNVTGAGYDDAERYESYEDDCINPRAHTSPGGG